MLLTAYGKESAGCLLRIDATSSLSESTSSLLGLYVCLSKDRTTSFLGFGRSSSLLNAFRFRSVEALSSYSPTSMLSNAGYLPIVVDTFGLPLFRGVSSPSLGGCIRPFAERTLCTRSIFYFFSQEPYMEKTKIFKTM